VAHGLRNNSAPRYCAPEEHGFPQKFQLMGLLHVYLLWLDMAPGVSGTRRRMWSGIEVGILQKCSCLTRSNTACSFSIRFVDEAMIDDLTSVSIPTHNHVQNSYAGIYKRLDSKMQSSNPTLMSTSPNSSTRTPCP
jgi:hypothetical protein